MNRIKTWLAPNSTDIWIAVSLPYLVLAIVFGVLSHHSSSFIVGLEWYQFQIFYGGALLFALGAAASFGRVTRKSFLWNYLFCILMPLLFIGIHVACYSFPRVVRQLVQVASPEYVDQSAESIWREFWSWQYIVTNIIFALTPFIVMVVFLLIRVGPSGMTKVSRHWSWSRAKTLTVVAAALLGLTFLNNLLNVFVFGFDNHIMFGMLMFVVYSLLFIVVGSVLYWPVRFFGSHFGLWIKLLVWTILVGGVVGYLWFNWRSFWMSAGPDGLLITWAVIVACVAPIAVAGYCHENLMFGGRKKTDGVDGADEESSSDGDLTSGSPLRKTLPSLWGVVAIILCCLSVVFPYRYDIPTLIHSSGDWDAARSIAESRIRSKGQILASGGLTFRSVRCLFDKSTDPNVLELIEPEPVYGFDLRGDSGVVDFSRLKVPSIESVYLGIGQLKTSQLNDLLDRDIKYLTVAGTRLVDANPSALAKNLRNITFPEHIREEFETDVAGFLAGFRNFESVEEISVYKDVDSEDWDEILRAAESTNVIVHEFDSLTDSELVKATSNIQLEFSRSFFGDYHRRQRVPAILRDSDAKILYRTDSVVADYKVLLAYPNRFKLTMSSDDAQEFDFEQENSPLVIARNNEGQLTELYLPLDETNSKVSECVDLEILSFDLRWIQDRGSLSCDTTVVDLSKLVNLKQLYFDPASDVGQIDFLAFMRNLKVLQIPPVDRSLGGSVGYHSCPSLEKVILLGIPDEISISELKRLPNLTALVLVDVLGEFQEVDAGFELAGLQFQTKEQARVELEQKLPGVKIEVVAEQDMEADIPESFKRHLKSIQGKLREELADVSMN